MPRDARQRGSGTQSSELFWAEWAKRPTVFRPGFPSAWLATKRLRRGWKAFTATFTDRNASQTSQRTNAPVVVAVGVDVGVGVGGVDGVGMGVGVGGLGG